MCIRNNYTTCKRNTWIDKVVNEKDNIILCKVDEQEQSQCDRG